MTITNVMNIERVLLEIQSRHMFDLSMSELLRLFGYLRRIGDMTNMFFYAQEMFTERSVSEQDLLDYRERLSSDDNVVLEDEDEIKWFIGKLCGRLGDSEVEETAAKLGVLPEIT